jgi:hypothetical protein
VEHFGKRTKRETEQVRDVITVEMGKLKRKIEDGGQLCIPKYVSERVNLCIRNLENYCSETDIMEAWEELKENYGKISGGNHPTNLYRSLCHIIAYLRYYFFLNYPAIKWILLKNLEKDMEIIPRKDSVKVLDYGAGPGTASMAVCDFLEDAKEMGICETTKIKLYFDEQSGDFVECYRQMLRRHGKVESLRYVFEGGQNMYKEGFFDTIILSYVLNELEERLYKQLIDNVCSCLKEGGYLIILESAYKGMRKDIGDFLNDRLVRRFFKVVDASGSFCSEELCEELDECYDKSIKRKKLKTPEGMTGEMKRFFEEKKGGRIRWVYVVLKKVAGQEGFVDPSELNGCQEIGGKIFKLRGWVIEKKSSGIAENIALCNGLGRCNLAFWRDRGELSERVGEISEGDILCVRGKSLIRSFEELPSISVTEIVEHIKRVD